MFATHDSHLCLGLRGHGLHLRMRTTCMEDYDSHTELLNMIYTSPSDPTHDRHSPFQPRPSRRVRRRRWYFSMSLETSLYTYVCFRHLPMYQAFVYLCLRGKNLIILHYDRLQLELKSTNTTEHACPSKRPRSSPCCSG
jgi:hypothetical protein